MLLYVKYEVTNHVSDSAMLNVCVFQATTLLTMDKYSMQDVQNVHNTCFKLNSLQLHALMTNYHCAPDEPYIPPVSLQVQVEEEKKSQKTVKVECRCNDFLMCTGAD